VSLGHVTPCFELHSSLNTMEFHHTRMSF